MLTFGSMRIELQWEGDLLNAQVVCYCETVERPYEVTFFHQVRVEDLVTFRWRCRGEKSELGPGSPRKGHRELSKVFN